MVNLTQGPNGRQFRAIDTLIEGLPKGQGKDGQGAPIDLESFNPR